MSETPLVLPSPFTFSQSSLQDYADCPRRFALRYLQRLAWPAIKAEPAREYERHQEEGRQFHRLVQRHLIGIPAETLTPLANTDSLSRWWTHYLASEEARLREDSAWTLYPEITLSAPFGAYRLLAKYDLLAIHESGKALILDWKTYRKRPRNEHLAARWQTRVYRYLLVEAGSKQNGGRPVSPSKIEMRYWFAEFPHEAASFSYSESEYKRDKALLEKIIAEIANAREFPPTEEERACRFCVYRSYCARGIGAAPAEGAEEIEGELEFDFEEVEEIAF